ncbi:hypothetical protein AGLY_010270 [Aphis glycines]|uniref:Uncharacterized protein n=1 Tax=Aphis glycines TaxID=307491 RepID=A0A6G0TGD4_APHGL|nr:hypothetical protein AGLY_010270 [Aphis glycines]
MPYWTNVVLIIIVYLLFTYIQTICLSYKLFVVFLEIENFYFVIISNDIMMKIHLVRFTSLVYFQRKISYKLLRVDNITSNNSSYLPFNYCHKSSTDKNWPDLLNTRRNSLITEIGNRFEHQQKKYSLLLFFRNSYCAIINCFDNIVRIFSINNPKISFTVPAKVLAIDLGLIVLLMLMISSKVTLPFNMEGYIPFLTFFLSRGGSLRAFITNDDAEGTTEIVATLF